MTQLISSLTYQAISPSTNKGIATLVLDPNVDLDWQVSMLGSVQGAPNNVVPKFISVDNINGAVGITTKLGYFQYQTPAFQRETTFNIPDGITQATFTFELGAITPVTVYISEDKIADSMSNQLAVQVTAAKTLVYQFVNVTASQNQQLNSGNTQINFVPLLAGINYNLLDIAGAPVDNGFLQFIQNLGAFPVTIIPFGAQTINDGALTSMPGFNAASPMILNPGDSGILSSDGTNWFFRGVLSYVSPDIVMASGALSTLTHSLGRIPTSYEHNFKCLVAANGYAVGDEIPHARSDWNVSDQVRGDGVRLTPTQIILRQSVPAAGTTIFTAINFNTGATFDVNYTSVQWCTVIRAKAFW